MKHNNRGFAHLVLLLVILGLVVGSVGYYVVNKSKTNTSPSDSRQSSQAAGDASSDSNQASGSNKPGCTAGAAGIFTKDVTDMSKVSLIQNPIRLVGGSNIKTHSYIEVSERSPVYAPMDATLTGGANYYETGGEMPVTKVQYLLSFNDGCDLVIWLDHLVDVPDTIKNAFPPEPRNDTQGVQVNKVAVKAGELVGYTNQTARARFDFGVFNLAGPETSLTTNPKYKDDPIVQTSNKYRYATCPYNFYDEATMQKYQALYDGTVSGDQAIIDDICD